MLNNISKGFAMTIGSLIAITIWGFIILIIVMSILNNYTITI